MIYGYTCSLGLFGCTECWRQHSNGLRLARYRRMSGCGYVILYMHCKIMIHVSTYLGASWEVTTSTVIYAHACEYDAQSVSLPRCLLVQEKNRWDKWFCMPYRDKTSTSSISYNTYLPFPFTTCLCVCLSTRWYCASVIITWLPRSLCS